MKHLICASLAVVCFQGLALGQSGADQQPLQPVDIFSLEMTSDAQISPDGSKIVYTRRSNDIMSDTTRNSLWLIDYDGSDHVPLVTGKGSYSSARWSPDGDRLAYISSEDGESRIVVRWMDSETEVRIAPVGMGPSGLSWSHDGQSIAYTAFIPGPGPQVDINLPEKPAGAEWSDSPLIDDTIVYEFDGSGELPDGNSQIFIVSSQGGTPQQVTNFSDRGALSGLEWSRDNSILYFASSAYAGAGYDFNESDILSVNLNSGETTRITDFPGTETSPSLSPDGRTLAWVGFENTYQSNLDQGLYLMDLASGEIEQLQSDLDRSISRAVWDRSGNGLWVSFVDRGQSNLAYVSTSDRLTRITDRMSGQVFGRPYTSSGFSISDNGRFAALIGSGQDLSNIGVGTRRSRDVRQITDVNADVLGQRDLAEIEEMTWESSADGREIQGWIAYPPGFDPAEQYPFILEIHGGPHTSYGPVFSGEVQLMAAAGYVVLYANPRGSTSYGMEFANLIDKNYPGEDVADLISGVDAIIERGFIDEDRLFVTGGSGGGVLTAEIISIDHRFAAAVVAKPVINWTSFTLAADVGPILMPYWFNGTPWDNQDEYWSRSPLSRVGQVETPAMLLVGGADRRTPLFESEQYYQALQYRGIPTRLVRIPGAFHGIADSRPSRLLYKVGHILAWFEEHDPTLADE